MKFTIKALVAACVIAASVPAFAADYTLSINTALTTHDPLYKGLEHFRDAVEKRSDGAIDVRLFPNSQLGPDEDVLGQARVGMPVAVVVDGGRLAVYVKKFGVLNAPYLVSGYEGMRKIVTSPLFDKWTDKLSKAGGLQILSFNWWQGARQLWTNVPVKTPADLKGSRMRTPGAPVWTATVAAMGAQPTPMPYASVYPALQQGVIDSVAAQLPAGYGSKLYEVTDYLTMTSHINLISGLVTSAAWFNSLPGELQTILREEALKAGDVASYATRDALVKLKAELKAHGMTVNEIDVTPFRKATVGVYDKLGYAELRDKLQAIAAE